MAYSYIHKFIAEILLWAVASLVAVAFYLIAQYHDIAIFDLLWQPPWRFYFLGALFVKVLGIGFARTYLQNWRYTSFRDAERLLLVVGLCTICLVVTGLAVFSSQRWLLVIPVLDGILTLAFALAIRLVRRLLWDRLEGSSADSTKRFLMIRQSILPQSWVLRSVWQNG